MSCRHCDWNAFSLKHIHVLTVFSSEMPAVFSTWIHNLMNEWRQKSLVASFYYESYSPIKKQRLLTSKTVFALNSDRHSEDCILFFMPRHCLHVTGRIYKATKQLPADWICQITCDVFVYICVNFPKVLWTCHIFPVVPFNWSNTFSLISK